MDPGWRATVLLVSAQERVRAQVTAQLLGWGVGRVLWASTPAGVNEVVRAGESGDVAIVHPALHRRHRRVVTTLRRAGWGTTIVATVRDSAIVTDALSALGRHRRGADRDRPEGTVDQAR